MGRKNKKQHTHSMMLSSAVVQDASSCRLDCVLIDFDSDKDSANTESRQPEYNSIDAINQYELHEDDKKVQDANKVADEDKLFDVELRQSHYFSSSFIDEVYCDNKEIEEKTKTVDDDQLSDVECHQSESISVDTISQDHIHIHENDIKEIEEIDGLNASFSDAGSREEFCVVLDCIGPYDLQKNEDITNEAEAVDKVLQTIEADIQKFIGIDIDNVSQRELEDDKSVAGNQDKGKIPFKNIPCARKLREVVNAKAAPPKPFVRHSSPLQETLIRLTKPKLSNSKLLNSKAQEAEIIKIQRLRRTYVEEGGMIFRAKPAPGMKGTPEKLHSLISDRQHKSPSPDTKGTPKKLNSLISDPQHKLPRRFRF
jgi:hypothetical protein